MFPRRNHPYSRPGFNPRYQKHIMRHKSYYQDMLNKILEENKSWLPYLPPELVDVISEYAEDKY